jgi:hypothetical protein
LPLETLAVVSVAANQPPFPGVQPQARPLLACSMAASTCSCSASSSGLARRTTCVAVGCLAMSVRAAASISRVVAEIHDQAFLTAGHRQVDLGENLGVEQGAVQRALRVVDAVALAQRVEVVLLAGVQILGHAQGVADRVADRVDRRHVEQGEFGVEEADVESGVVDDEFGAADKVEKLGRNVGKARLVEQETRG